MLRGKANIFLGLALMWPSIFIAQDWKALFQASSTSTVLSRGVHSGPQGSFYWTGIFEDVLQIGADSLQSAGSSDGFISKFNKHGSQAWSLRIGGTALDRIMASTVDDAGNLYITGGFSDELIIGPDTLYSPFRDVFVAKFDSNGHAVWAQHIVGNNSDFGQAILVDDQRAVYVAGIFMSDSLTIGSLSLRREGRGDMFMIKLSSQGQAIWGKQAGSFAITQATALARDSVGHIYVAGSFQDSVHFDAEKLTGAGRSDIFLASYEASGQLRWTRRLGGAGFDVGQSLAGTEDGVSLAGRYSDSILVDTFVLPHAGSYDLLLAKYDSLGELAWVRHAGGISRDGAFGLSYQREAGILLGGEFTDRIQMGTHTLTAQGRTDLFLAKYDAYGSIRWAIAAGGGDKDQVYALCIEDARHPLLAGHFRATALFDTIQLASRGRDDAFLAKIYDQDSIPQPPAVPRSIEGFVYVDEQENCQHDSGELGMNRWLIQAMPGAFFGLTDAQGKFSPDWPHARYAVQSIMPDQLEPWLYSACPQIQYFAPQLPFAQQTNPAGFGQVPRKVALAQLSMRSDAIVPCQTGELVIEYANMGTTALQHPQIELMLPAELQITASNFPYQALKGGKFEFAQAQLAAQATAQIKLTYFATCSLQDRLGGHLSIKAHLRAENMNRNVSPQWLGADLIIKSAWIGSDSSLFVIKNQGDADLDAPVQARVFVNDELCQTFSISLAAGDSLGYVVQTAGQHIRMEVEQAPFHPQQSWISATVDTMSGANTYFDQYSHFDDALASSFQLNPIIQSYAQPEGLVILPLGRGKNHLIEAEERLYQSIYIDGPANGGSQQILLIDSLSSWVDPASIRWEASSHAFELDVYGRGSPVVSFKLDSLRERAWVAFSYRLNPKVPLGTYVEHQAWIQRDSVAPIATASYRHQVGHMPLSSCGIQISPYDFNPVISTHISSEFELSAYIYPNPVIEQLTIDLPQKVIIEEICLSDISGRVLLELHPQANKAIIPMQVFSKGLYVLHLKTQAGIFTQKLCKK